MVEGGLGVLSCEFWGFVGVLGVGVGCGGFFGGGGGGEG